MIEAINWFMAHQEEVKEIGKALVVLYLAVVGVASLIVKLTPTLKDDTILKDIIRFVGRYIALNR